MSRDARAPADPLIGRKRELEELRAGIGQIQAGYGRVMLVDGEPGIGKTRLAEELVREAEVSGMTVLWGACQEGESAPAFWPWVQIVRAALREASDPGADEARPHLARLLGDRASGVSRPALRAAESIDEPFELFDEVTSLLRRLSDARPLLVVLDDLHWADHSSLRVLQFLSREIRLARIGVLGTYREHDLHASPVRTATLAAVLRSATRLGLRGLSLEETGALVALVRKEEPPPALVAAVHEATGGSPFFSRELARLGSVPLRDRSGHLAVPEAVRATIRERLATLPEPCREALGAAAVLGEEIDAAILEALLAAPAGALEEPLETAVAAALLFRSNASAEGFRFAHALIRDTLYADLAPDVRVALHARAARAIGQLRASNLVPHLGALAHHYERAALPAEAAAWAERAGLRALEVSAYEEGLGHLERALALAERAEAMESRGERPGAGASRARLLYALGLARKAAGDYAAGNVDLERAAHEARRAAEPAIVALAALEHVGYQRRFDRVDAARVARLEEALESLDEGEEVLRARLEARLAYQRWLPGSDDAGTAAALALARRSGDPLAIGEALFAEVFCLVRPDLRDGAEGLFAEMREIAEANGFSFLEWQARVMAAWLYVESGDVAGFRREVEGLEARVRRPVNRVNLLTLRGSAAYLEGRFDEARTLFREAEGLAARFDHVIRGVVEFALLEPDRAEGRLAEIEPRLAALPPIEHWKRCMAVSVYAALGRDGGARRELDALGDLRRFPVDLRWLANLCDLAEAAIVLGDRERMSVLHELLLPFADRLASGYISIVYRGAVESYLGALDAALGRRDEARTRLEAGLARNERVGVPHATAWSQVVLAEVLAAGGEPARAASLLEAALATAGEIGMRHLAGRAEAALARLGQRPERPATPAPPAAADTVLRQEGEYWSVAFAGRIVRLRDSKGMRDLAVLLASPGREVHVADLIAREAAGEAPPARTPGAREIAEEGLTMSSGASTGERLDARARDEYRVRLAELRAELDDAEQVNDLGRASKIRAELDFLAGELASAYGLGGRARGAGNPAERARKAVAGRIRYAVDRIRETHPALARHLERSLRTGIFCSYSPDPPVTWAVG